MIKVLSIFGTRPEAIKMAPVVRALAARRDQVQSTVCVTGQHRQMLDQVLTLFNIKPDHDLDLMQPNQSLPALTARLLMGLDEIIAREQPDWVLVQGDTTTALAAGMVAFYRRVSLGHIEAGLRTYDLDQPFPEEFNRRVVDLTAALHFAPTARAEQNLQAERVPKQRIVVTGNTGIDALFWAAKQPYDARHGPLRHLDWGKRLVAVTVHRRESFGEPVVELCHALRNLASRFEADAQFVLPVHPNPNVSTPIKGMLGDLPNLLLIEPLDYLALVHLLKRSTLVLTDSGGLQEEAPSLGVPVLVLRNVTERPEAIEAGGVRLVGCHRQAIVEWASRLLTDEAHRAAMAQARLVYGDGRAAPRIVDALLAPHVRGD